MEITDHGSGERPIRGPATAQTAHVRAQRVRTGELHRRTRDVRTEPATAGTTSSGEGWSVGPPYWQTPV